MNQFVILRDYIKRKPFTAIGIGLFSLLFLAAIVVGLTTDNTKQGGKTGGDRAAPDSFAAIAYQNQPYQLGFNVTQNILIQTDLAYFARQTYPTAYNPSTQPGVLFILDKPVSITVDNTSFSGHFEKMKANTVKVTFSVLKNNRIQSSIKDTTTNTNIDSQLPSASSYEQLIAQLPISASHYFIDYVPSSNSVSVTIPEQQSAYLDEANQLLSQKLGVPTVDLSKYKIDYIYPTNADYGTGLIQQ